MPRLLTVEEANEFLTANPIDATAIPAYGMIVTAPDRSVLVFRKTNGEIILIDVTGQIPAHFRQSYPAVPAELARALAGIVDPSGATQAVYDWYLGKIQTGSIDEAIESVTGAVVAAVKWTGVLLLGAIALGLFLRVRGK